MKGCMGLKSRGEQLQGVEVQDLGSKIQGEGGRPKGAR